MNCGVGDGMFHFEMNAARFFLEKNIDLTIREASDLLDELKQDRSVARSTA